MEMWTQGIDLNDHGRAYEAREWPITLPCNKRDKAQLA